MPSHHNLWGCALACRLNKSIILTLTTLFRVVTICVSGWLLLQFLESFMMSHDSGGAMSLLLLLLLGFFSLQEGGCFRRRQEAQVVGIRFLGMVFEQVRRKRSLRHNLIGTAQQGRHFVTAKGLLLLLRHGADR
jgi:hypothetical protein